MAEFISQSIHGGLRLHPTSTHPIFWLCWPDHPFSLFSQSSASWQPRVSPSSHLWRRFLKPLIHLPSQELWKILLPHAKAGHVLDSCGIEAWVSWHATRTWSPMYTNVKWGVLYVMVCKWKHEVMHPYCDVAQKWYHITKVASNHQILCFSQIPTRARRARPPNSNCHERAERVLVFHEKQTSPKASLNFKGSLQHPNLSLPPAFSTNPNARSARSSIQLKTKTWNITLQKESIAEMLWSSEHNIALHLFCFSTNPNTRSVRSAKTNPSTRSARSAKTNPITSLTRAQRAGPQTLTPKP